MNYIKVIIKNSIQEDIDSIIALLEYSGFAGFEETETGLFAYIEDTMFDENDLFKINKVIKFNYCIESVSSQNWNELWESNFEPVVVDGFCTVRAIFHEINMNTPFEIIITPKMSFGTGHHATTQSMMSMMKTFDFKGLDILDFGTGTGVLAILAEKLGAKTVLAIDNDEWAVTNALENVSSNGCINIIVEKGTISEIAIIEYDIVLANINRQVLVESFPDIYKRLKKQGILIMSGFISEDKDILVKSAVSMGFLVDLVKEQTGWLALSLKK